MKGGRDHSWIATKENTENKRRDSKQKQMKKTKITTNSEGKEP
jgi:hypothetical protein